MTLTEYLFIGLIIFGAVIGYSKGLLKQISSLSGLLIGYFLAITFLPQIHHFFVDKGILSVTSSSWFSFFLTILLVFLSVRFLSKLIEEGLKSIGLNFTNKFAGMLLGSIKYVLIGIVAFYFLYTLGFLSEKNASPNVLGFLSLFKTILSKLLY